MSPPRHRSNIFDHFALRVITFARLRVLSHVFADQRHLRLEDLLHTAALPLVMRRKSQQPRDRRRGVEQADRRVDHIALADARPGRQPGDGHVFGQVGAMVAIVPAVVAMQNDRGVSGQRIEHGAQRAIDRLQLAQVAFRHPAIVVAGGIDRAKIDECEIGHAFREHARDLVGGDAVAIGLVAGVAEVGDVEAAGPADIAQLLPVIEERRALAGRMRQIEQPRQRPRQRRPLVRR